MSTAAPPSGIRVWVHAVRPATLPAALASVVVGLGAALGAGVPFRPDTALACVAVAVLLQVAANLANDLSDHRRGADTPDRAGPLRVAAAGLVSERALEVAIALVLLAAGLAGLYLVAVGGPVLLVVGALAMVAALAYTGGPVPYGYRALGDVAVFAFFGFVAVAGTAYLQGLRVEPLFVVASLPPGALITAILVVNNLRDIPTDRAAGKRTLAVVLGPRAARREYDLLLAVAYGVPLALVAAGLASGEGVAALLPVLPLATLPAALGLRAVVHGFAEPARLNPVLRGTARLAFLHGLLFAAGLALAALLAGTGAPAA